MNFSLDEFNKKISNAESFKQLGEERDKFNEMIQDLHTSIEQIKEINQIHDLFIQRTITLSETTLRGRGFGPPPVSYDFILFGSGGRQEQTLWSDQDNGIVYENPNNEHKEKVKSYFKELAITIEHGLERAGYPPCEGNVISTNPLWNKPLDDWYFKMNEWFEDPHWEHVRYLLILADSRSVYGQGILINKIKTRYFSEVASLSPRILEKMLHNTLRHKILLGVFGHLIKEQYGEEAGGLDIKYGAYIPMVNGIRLLSIEAGLFETSTLERIHKLKLMNLIPERYAAEYEKAFSNIFKLRYRTLYKKENGMYTSNGILKAKQLTKEQREELKSSLKIANKLQKYIKKKIDSSR
ncbi:DUF294 nucleotidyltransferase-like domain-containing protein [Chengkuizengella axinellae]|uniref:DUF294 nucleotidyltransferase-like domain-containing protein n=1 Tax=Chengkuizengella axinellae TaxID=3064388 RepID=A0ABT9IYV2_9BACL|nr:DUF294 nucleotidyltransferase-like domain-containing protein [Chengkuizengella sp. 2205SS18-9]MDP5274549.1 DUF294 nucleotidyltransferase-like domain-containing protein [Chengkuizengella sp. 2205SS18-9]